MSNHAIGLGNPNALLNVHIANIPPLATYEHLQICRPMEEAEITYIVENTGNHWRKIFNIYAKLIFELYPTTFDSWQALREQQLLQKRSDHNLLFSPPSSQNKAQQDKNITIIMGKTYATHLGYADSCDWLSEHFAIHEKERIIICPYFDYRQLSNIKITQLCQLIKRFL